MSFETVVKEFKKQAEEISRLRKMFFFSLACEMREELFSNTEIVDYDSFEKVLEIYRSKTDFFLDDDNYFHLYECDNYCVEDFVIEGMWGNWNVSDCKTPFYFDGNNDHEKIFLNEKWFEERKNLLTE